MCAAELHSSMSSIAALQEGLQRNGYAIPRYTYEFLGHEKHTNRTQHVATVHMDDIGQRYRGDSRTDKQGAKESAAARALVQLGKRILGKSNALKRRLVDTNDQPKKRAKLNEMNADASITDDAVKKPKLNTPILGFRY